MPKTLLVALATLLTALPTGTSTVPAEDPWRTLLEAELGAVPATALVDGEAVPIAEALGRLRHPPPLRATPGPGADGAATYVPDVGVAARSHTNPCEFTAYVSALRRGSGPAEFALEQKTIVPAAAGLGGVTPCGFPWIQGTATAEASSKVSRRACVVDAPLGTWVATRENCHYDDFGTAAIQGKVGFSDYFFRLGANWVRLETMYAVPGPSPVPVGTNLPDASIIHIG